jgi:integrase
VEKDDLRQYRIWLEKKPIRPLTVSHVLSDARCFLFWCEDSGYVSRAPVPRRLLPRIQQTPPDRLTDDEVVTLLKELDAPLLWVVRFGLATGMRWGEMARAQVSDVDFKLGVITVHQTKSGRMRTVPLPPDILAELRQRVGRILRYSERSTSSIARDVRKVTGIKRFHLH